MNLLYNNFFKDDGATPSRIPQRRSTNTSSTPVGAQQRPSRLSVTSFTRNGGNTGHSAFGSTISKPRTPSGSASPAPTR